MGIASPGLEHDKKNNTNTRATREGWQKKTWEMCQGGGRHASGVTCLCRLAQGETAGAEACHPLLLLSLHLPVLSVYRQKRRAQVSKPPLVSVSPSCALPLPPAAVAAHMTEAAAADYEFSSDADTALPATPTLPLTLL